MSKIEDGGPAFPAAAEYQDPRYIERHAELGMSLRDYFAAVAFQSLVLHRERSVSDTYSKPELAAEAYHYADAMLAARTTTKGGE